MDPGDVHTKQLLEEAGDLIRAIVLCGRGQLPQCRDFCLSLIRPLSAKDPVFFPLVIALLRSVCAHEPALMPSHNREGLREHYKNLIRGCDNSFGRESVRIGDSIICHFRKERTRIEMEESQLPSPGYSCNDVTDNGENGTNTSISIIRNNNSSVDSRRALGVSLYIQSMLHVFGAGSLPTDWEHAVSLLRESASLGDSASLFTLGICHELGDVGLPIDHPEALRLYQMAAKQDFACAIYNLAVVVEDSDVCRAVGLYRRASELGVAKAQYSLAIILCEGGGPTNDVREAKRYLLLAATQGHLKSITKLWKLFRAHYNGN